MPIIGNSVEDTGVDSASSKRRKKNATNIFIPVTYTTKIVWNFTAANNRKVH